MGWNPYNCLSSRTAIKEGCWPPTESVLKQTAAALNSSGLQALGYNYINLDGGWSVPARDNHTGRVQWNSDYYPSGLPAVARELQAAGAHWIFCSTIFVYQIPKDRPQGDELNRME